MTNSSAAAAQNKNQTSGDITVENVETVECVEADMAVEETIAIEESLVIKTDIPLLPIEQLNRNIAVYELTDKEQQMREQLIDDIKNAEHHTILALFYYLKVGKRLITIKASLSGIKGRYTKFLESIGMHERKAQRYMKIAKDERFSNMDEEEIKRLHHLTQNQLEALTKFKDDAFYAAIRDTNFELPKKGSSNGSGKDVDYVIDDTLYQTFMDKDKKYVINEYNALLKKFIQLQQQLSESVVIEADVIANIDSTANVYTTDVMEVA